MNNKKEYSDHLANESKKWDSAYAELSIDREIRRDKKSKTMNKQEFETQKKQNKKALSNAIDNLHKAGRKRTMEKLYFRSIDDTICETLEDIISDAKLDGLTEITVVEALPDDGTHGFIWCTVNGECIEQSECKKSQCSSYASTSGRGRCQNKGKLYLHGEERTFKIKTDE